MITKTGDYRSKKVLICRESCVALSFLKDTVNSRRHCPFARRHRPSPPTPAASISSSSATASTSSRSTLPLIPSLSCKGLTPSSIEEAIGIVGVEQNCLVVAAQILDSLLFYAFPVELVPYFDSFGGTDLLYELCFLNTIQCANVARHAIDRHLDLKGVRELAFAMKDFPRRCFDDGWKAFTEASLGDCLAFACFR